MMIKREYKSIPQDVLSFISLLMAFFDKLILFSKLALYPEKSNFQKKKK